MDSGVDVSEYVEVVGILTGQLYGATLWPEDVAEKVAAALVAKLAERGYAWVKSAP